MDVPLDVAQALLKIGHAGFFEPISSTVEEPKAHPPQETPRKRPLVQSSTQSSLADALDTAGVKPRGGRPKA